MLALATGWTPDVVAGETGQVSAAFREAAHWTLYVQAIVGPEGLPRADEPQKVTEQSARAARLQLRALLATIHKLLYPEDEPTGG